MGQNTDVFFNLASLSFPTGFPLFSAFIWEFRGFLTFLNVICEKLYENVIMSTILRSMSEWGELGHSGETWDGSWGDMGQFGVKWEPIKLELFH